MATRLNKTASRPRKRPVLHSPVLTLAVAVTFGLGLTVPIAGFVLVIIHAAMPGLKAIADIATILIIITIPLLLLSSHLMDLYQKRKDAAEPGGFHAKYNDN